MHVERRRTLPIIFASTFLLYTSLRRFMSNRVRVGVVGTSWWTDAMYLPPLSNHPSADVIAVCGRNATRANEFAKKWNIPKSFTDFSAMLAQDLDAVIVASSNKSHYEYTMQALERGLHVLCEKPLAMNLSQAREMTALAQRKGVKHMVPFTYSFMPTTRFLKQLLDQNYIGKPYHLNMRYYAGYARSGEYLWRFDTSEAGSGVLGDLGPHWLYLARMFFGDIKAVTCVLGYNVQRQDKTDGQSYPRGDDSAMMLLQFASGAQGNIHVSAVCHEGTPFGQTHHIELHGSDGTLYSYTDWDKTQEVRGAKASEGMPKVLEIPDSIWGKARRDTVHNTYRDVFRVEDNMTRGFITAILEDKPVSPNFVDGLRIQQITDAAILSAKEGRKVEVDSL